jgi:pimeloyl-ACP methyl ester carboxylesterase
VTASRTTTAACATFAEGWLAARSVADVATGRALFQTLPELYPLPFRDVSAETLLVTGAHTGLFGRLIARHVTTSLPRPPRRVVVDAAHWLIPEALPAVADAVARFVDGR